MLPAASVHRKELLLLLLLLLFMTDIQFTATTPLLVSKF